MSSYLTPGTVLGEGKYLLGNKLGSGSHGDVYFGKICETEEDVAIKLESWDVEQIFLSHENQVYKILEGGIGFPKSRWFGQEQRHNAMVIDLLGPSLQALFNQCDQKFSLKTVVMLAAQLTDRVEYLHQKNFIHRSIKPENFSVGRRDRTMVYMIDFGNAKRYTNKTGQHIKCKVYSELGLANCNSRHQSIGALQRMERSRRDDLESLGYMLIYFLRGSLPWDDVMDDPVALKDVKMGTSVEELCDGCPEEFSEYMKYVRSLEFEEKPDYDYIRNIFKKLVTRTGLEFDGKFDWISTEERKPTSEIFSAPGVSGEVKVQER